MDWVYRGEKPSCPCGLGFSDESPTCPCGPGLEGKDQLHQTERARLVLVDRTPDGDFMQSHLCGLGTTNGKLTPNLASLGSSDCVQLFPVPEACSIPQSVLLNMHKVSFLTDSSESTFLKRNCSYCTVLKRDYSGCIVLMRDCSDYTVPRLCCSDIPEGSHPC